MRCLVIFVFIFVSNGLKASDLCDISKDFVDNILGDIYITLSNKVEDGEVYNYFQELVPSIFDMEYIALWSLGHAYRQQDPLLVEEYLAVMKEYLIIHYSEVFYENYRDFDYRVLDSRPVADEICEVRILVIPKAHTSYAKQSNVDGAQIEVIWRLRYYPSGGNYLIADIVFAGVSFLNTQRKVTGTSVRSGQLDILVNDLRTKIIDAEGIIFSESKKYFSR